jgi:hypothetical protein
MGVRNLAPKHVGRKEYLMKCLQSSKVSRSRVSLKVRPLAPIATMIVGFGWADGSSENR